MSKFAPVEQEISEAMRFASMVKQDERFQAAILIAHPDIHIGVHTEPCTDNPQPMTPAITIRAGNGFDYPRGE